MTRPKHEHSIMVTTDTTGMVHLARVSITYSSSTRLFITAVTVSTGCNPAPHAWSASGLIAADYPTTIPNICLNNIKLVKYAKQSLISAHPTCVVCAAASTSLGS